MGNFLKNCGVPILLFYGIGSALFFIIDGSEAIYTAINHKFMGISARYLFGFVGFLTIIFMPILYLDKANQIGTNNNDIFVITRALWDDLLLIGKVYFVIGMFSIPWAFYILIDKGW